jgi:putative spermidine/putrescine transport system permease protein
MNRSNPTGRSFAALILVIWSILPLVPLAIWSFARGWRYPDLWPSEVSLAAWTFAMSDRSGVMASLLVSSFISTVVAVLAMAMAIPAARILALHHFAATTLIGTAFVVPILMPGIVVAMGLHGVFLAMGLTNTLTGVIVVHLVPTVPYAVLIMVGIFARYDTAHEDQARCLGARPAQVFWHITLPAVLPGVLVGGLFAFLISWSQFILTLMIGGGRVTTLPLLLFGFATSGRNDLTGAIGVIYVLPGLLILLATSRALTGRHAAMLGAGQG